MSDGTSAFGHIQVRAPLRDGCRLESGLRARGPRAYFPRMRAAFFYDERFARDASGTWYTTTGTLPYAAFARYLKHFERLVVVGHFAATGAKRTVASGPGLEFACLDAASLRPARFLAAAARHARDVLDRVDCAIIRLPGVLGPLVARAATARRIPWLAEVVGNAFDSLWNHGSWKARAAAVPLHLVNRVAIAHAPYALYVTRRFLQRSYPPRGTSAGVSDVILDPPSAQTLARRLERIAARHPASPSALGLIGSYDVEFKGHETALRALAVLRRAGRGVILRCLGVGDPARWRARAAALGVGQAVEFGASLPQGAPVLEWMDALDLYLIPSLQEGLPRALVEAMSRGLPAVGSDRAGIPELLEPRCLHPVRDDGALARLIARLLDDPAAMKAQAVRNWRVASDFSRDVIDARRDALVGEFKAFVAAGGPRRGKRAFTPASESH